MGNIIISTVFDVLIACVLLCPAKVMFEVDCIFACLPHFFEAQSTLVREKKEVNFINEGKSEFFNNVWFFSHRNITLQVPIWGQHPFFHSEKITV